MLFTAEEAGSIDVAPVVLPHNESPSNHFVEEMLTAIATAENPVKDLDRQKKILEKLPSDFLVELKAHLYDAAQREEERRGTLGPGFEDMQLRGKVFELLVKYDEEISPPLTPLGEEVLALIDDPERYRLGKTVGNIRHPDLTYVKVNDQGQVVIQGFGEVKSGALNERALKQLETFEVSISRIQKAVNDRSHVKQLKKLGLGVLAQRKQQMEEADQKGALLEIAAIDFEHVLIIPAGRKADISLLGKNAYGDPLKEDAAMVARFEAVMKEVTVKNAAFSNDEIYRLASLLKEKIETNI